VQAQLDYWRRSLADLSVLNLPTDRPRSAAQTFTFCGASQTFTLPVPLSAGLKAFSQREGATLFMTLLAAFQLLLARYSRQDDIVVGTPIAGRRHDELEGLIGFFNNMLVLRTDLSGSATFQELLRQARETALGAYANQDVSFERLVEEIQAPRDPSRTPLFQVMFALQNVPLSTQELPGLSLQPLATDSQAAKFDLNLALKDTPQGLTGVLRYNADLFDAATIRRMLDHFQALLEAIVANPRQPLADVLLLSLDDQQWIDEHLHADEAATGPHEYIAPRTAVETVLADIWANVLSVERVGVTDNFFDLGGHSLKAAQLFSRTRETFRVNLPLRSLFEATTVDSLAQIIVAHEARPGQTEKIAQVLMRIRGMSAEERQTSLGRRERANV
jgi:non-ribosomal peptide synthetase component F